MVGIGESYKLSNGMGISQLAKQIRESALEEKDFINESLTDLLKPITLATLLAVPGVVDAKTLDRGLSKGMKSNQVVQVSDPKVQKKIYDIIGEDKCNDAALINAIARTLMSEAVGENSTEAFDAVASVIWNRAGGKKSKFANVIFLPSQFSGWKSFTYWEKRHFVIKPHGKALTNPSAWKYCVNLATSMVNGTFKPSGKWKYFYAHNRVTPKWASKLTNKETIGNHTFGEI